MNRTFAWLSEAYLPPKLDAALKHGGHFMMSWINRGVPVTRWRGTMQSSNRPASVLVAGDEPWVDYLPARLFKETPQRETLGNVLLWKLPRLLQEQRSSVDLTIVRVDRWSAHLLFDAQYLRVPEWVGMSVHLPLRPEIMRSKTVKNDIRKAKFHRLQSVVSRQPADFDAFYNDAYLPFVTNRHGRFAFVHDRRLMQRWFRQGGILWMKVDEQPVGGMLFSRQNGTFHFQALGMPNGELQLGRLGALSALYLYGFKHAREVSCNRVELGGNRPSLQDGVLRYKAKWGARLYDRRNTQFDLLLYWERFTSAVEELLSQSPLVFRDRDGLSGLHAFAEGRTVTPGDALQVYRRLWTDGLRRLYLISAAGWTADGPWPPQTIPIVPDGNSFTPDFFTRPRQFEPTLCS